MNCHVQLQIAQSALVWKQRLVATAASMPEDLIKAFLSAGAAAVISRSPSAKAELGAVQVAQFFEELYRVLFEDCGSISDALDAAGGSRVNPADSMCCPSQKLAAQRSSICNMRALPPANRAYWTRH